MQLIGPIRHRSTGAVLHPGTGSLYRARLEGADLRRADLRNASLGHAHLERADLRGADLTGADLDCASLQGADLRRAKLEGAKLDMAKLEGADLRRADLRRARLWRTALGGARLDGADLRDARFLFDGGAAYHARVYPRQLVRCHLSGDAKSFVGISQRWRLRWLKTRRWLSSLVALAAICWAALKLAAWLGN